MSQASRIVSLITLSVVIGFAARPATAQRLEETVIGTWEVDVEATEKLGGRGAQFAVVYSATGFRFEFKRDGRLFFASVGSDVGKGFVCVVEFKRDGGLIIRTIVNRKQEGKWKVVKVDESRKELTIETDVPDPGKVTVTMTKEGMVMRREGTELSWALRREKKREP